MLHRTRELLIQQLTQTGNALRGRHLAEFGWVFPSGNMGVSQAVRSCKKPMVPITRGCATSDVFPDRVSVEGVKNAHREVG